MSDLAFLALMVIAMGASWLYVVLSVLVPASIGVLVALSLIGAERLWRRLR